MKWTLLKNRITGARSARNNKTGEVITEELAPEAYAKIRKNAIASNNRKQKDDTMSSFGLVKCKGAVSGKTYWE